MHLIETLQYENQDCC